MQNKILVGAIVVLFLAVGFLFLNPAQPGKTIVQQLGGQPSSDHLSLEFFRSSLVDGGGAKSVSASTTLTANESCTLGQLTVTSVTGTASTTVTLASTTALTATCLPDIGSSRHFKVFNDSTTTVLFSAGDTNTSIEYNTSSTVQQGVYPGRIGVVTIIQNRVGSRTWIIDLPGSYVV